MGNSEVGHLNLGAGRPVLQDLPRIDAAIADGTFFERPAFLAACERSRTANGTLHLVSLVGPGGVHANDRQLVALVALAARQAVPHVRIHALLDGRDTPPSSGLGFTEDLEARLAAAHPDARIASIGGRYWAMDRDQRWDRTERGYDAIVHAESDHHAPSATAAIAAAYERGETDEFVAPTVIDGTDGAIRDHDPVIHANFRADRARQLTHALSEGPTFTAFDRTSPAGRPAPSDLLVVTMTEYEEGLAVTVAFPPEIVRSLADAVADAGWRQFHVAETEKYAHVTYFFNGGAEAAHPGEDRRLVPSQKVATYDLAPEMSAAGVTDALVEAIGSGQYDVIVANYANADMVGHTGVWDATLRGAGRHRRMPCQGGGGHRGGRRRRPRRARGRPRDHGRPRQRRRASRRGRASRDGPLAQPGPVRPRRPRGGGAVAPRRGPRRRGPDPPGVRRSPEMGRHDRSKPHPVIASVAVRTEDVDPWIRFWPSARSSSASR